MILYVAYAIATTAMPSHADAYARVTITIAAASYATLLISPPRTSRDYRLRRSVALPLGFKRVLCPAANAVAGVRLLTAKKVTNNSGQCVIQVNNVGEMLLAMSGDGRVTTTIPGRHSEVKISLILRYAEYFHYFAHFSLIFA